MSISPEIMLSRHIHKVRGKEILRLWALELQKNKKKVREIFERCDLNRNGALDAVEKRRFCRTMSPGLRRREVRVLVLFLDAIDAVGTGFLTFELLSRFLRQFLSEEEGSVSHSSSIEGHIFLIHLV